MCGKEKQEDLKKHYTRLNSESSGNNLEITRVLADLYDRITNCGTYLTLKCSNYECTESSGETFKRQIRQYCGIRICSNPGCRSKRKTLIGRKYDPKLNNFQDPRFMTLTLRGWHLLNRKPLDKLNGAWKQMSILLRKNGYLKAYIKVVEMVGHEWIDKDLNYREAYYWHLHVCYDGTYIAADVLRAAWKRFTGGSKWVRIERVKKNFSAGAYLRKYLSKMADDDVSLEEYHQVYKMKLISSWGCKNEIETLLEDYILIRRIRCEKCNARLIPDIDDSETH